MEKIKTQKYDAVVLSSEGEKDIFSRFARHFKSMPLPDEEVLPNLGMFLTSKALSRILFFYEIYRKILTTHGVIVEFGVRWGQTLSVMSALRGIFEPFNRHRKVIGFDTFDGFKGTEAKDGGKCKCKDGSFSVTENYQEYLEKLLGLQEEVNPISHLKRYELVKGDAVKTIPEYFKNNPETIISLAIFDFDIYKPTKVALETIKPHLCRGSVLVFDELSDDIFPGETIALQEVFGLNNVRIKRFPMTARVSYIEVE